MLGRFFRILFSILVRPWIPPLVYFIYNMYIIHNNIDVQWAFLYFSHYWLHPWMCIAPILSFFFVDLPTLSLCAPRWENRFYANQFENVGVLFFFFYFGFEFRVFCSLKQFFFCSLPCHFFGIVARYQAHCFQFEFDAVRELSEQLERYLLRESFFFFKFSSKLIWTWALIEHFCICVCFDKTPSIWN